ncbi:hypothetical protein R6Q59_032780 [Mikania micrantha]|uniref:Peroxidase n=1 Tax=Mikania micrantha TaxID=192012 RepID=A0A5N6NSA0_9ASTR|nr:hypothetical protein E3N88_17390 [Mikania micrantha]
MELHSYIKIPFLFVVLLATLALGSTRVGFYKTTCPQAETIVQSVVQSSIRFNRTYAPAILQMFFHDCFVNGCDASILLDGSSSEKTAPPNSGLRAYEVIDAAKSMLETVCPGVVSCADILALAARDSVVQTGGTHWAMPTGRRDGFVSLASEAIFPSPSDSIDVQIQKFAKKGLNIEDLVTLVGGHTIGTASCRTFSNRLYNYNNTNEPDPTIDQAFLHRLRTLCPHGGDDATRVALDTESVNIFDTSYFENIKRGRGVLESDSLLWSDPRTQKYVKRFIGAKRPHRLTTFKKMFGKAMVKMSKIGLKTGNHGEIRRVCNKVN